MNIFIGCSSKDNLEGKYYACAAEIVQVLKKHTIITGGTVEGLMGVVNKNVPNERKIGIILKDYIPKNFDESGVKTIICETTFQRLAEIWNASDVFLFLPGGVGTFSEILGFLEENRTKLEKKLIVFNQDGYYDCLRAMLEVSKDLLFSDESVLTGITFVDTINDLEKELME